MTADEKAKALTSPSSMFTRPSEVIACGDLSRSEKIAVLRQWELDARLLQVAAEEGMANGERSLFADVKAAQSRLAAAPLKDAGAPSKVGP
jgi:hypothetical protein